MNWFGLKNSKIPAPNDKRPSEWSVQQDQKPLSRTRPKTVSKMTDLISDYERQGQYDDAVSLLRMNASPGLKMWLRSVIDPTITWRVDADVDWEPCHFEEATGALWSNFRKIYLYCTYPNIPSPLANFPKNMLDRKWGDFLSEHSKAEAQILLMACEKRLPFSHHIALAAFPELLEPIDQQQQARQMARKLAEREVHRLVVEKTRLEALTESEVRANQLLKNKSAALEQMNELLRNAQQKLAALS